jgi:putative membrane protein insertion efficiency factor
MTMTDDVPGVHTHSHDDLPPENGAGTGEGRGRFRPFTWLLLGMVRAYQAVVSPWLPRTCRYYPSCSAFAVGALRRHGAIKGTVLAIWRVLRCNPWSRGGVYHVPERGKWVGRREPLRDPTDPGDQTHP